jgi:hypothetical protein
MAAQRVPQNLPPQSQQWVRDVERRMEALERQNALLQITANRNAGQIRSIQQGVEALSLSTAIRTFGGSGVTTFPMVGSGATPFTFNYSVPAGYSKLSFVWSFRGERAGTLSRVNPKWDTIVFVNGTPAGVGFTSFTDDDSFTGAYTGTLDVSTGDSVDFDTYCYMVDAGSQSVSWQTSGIIFAHN